MAVAVKGFLAEGFTHVAFGDLFLEDVRRYREERLAGTGLTPLFQGDRMWLGPVRDVMMGTFGRLPIARGEAAALMAGVSLGPFRRLDLEKLRNGQRV